MTNYCHVKSITYTALGSLASTINASVKMTLRDITRNRDQAVVMLSLAIRISAETAYLLRLPANAKRLITAVEALNRGKGVKRKLKA